MAAGDNDPDADEDANQNEDFAEDSDVQDEQMVNTPAPVSSGKGSKSKVKSWSVLIILYRN